MSSCYKSGTSCQQQLRSLAKGEKQHAAFSSIRLCISSCLHKYVLAHGEAVALPQGEASL